MSVRPLHIFTLLASTMVAWLATRMCNPRSDAVWSVSATLGGWAPLIAAAMFTYVRRVERREVSLAAAWLVRGLGVYGVLLWMVGASDWLRGPPSRPPAWNIDAGTPLVFLAFAPCFALCAFIARHLLALHARLRMTARRAQVATLVPVHYRVAPAPSRRAVDQRATSVALGHLAAATVTAAALAAGPGAWVESIAAAVGLGLAASRGSVAPAVFALLALSARCVAREGDAMSLTMRWPAAFVALTAVFLVGAEQRLRRA